MSVKYHAYLASREWGLKKRAVRERCAGRCERCRMRRMTAVHHLTYAHVGNEPLEELLGVCEPCHDYLGGNRDTDPMDDVKELQELRRMHAKGRFNR